MADRVIFEKTRIVPANDLMMIWIADIRVTQSYSWDACAIPQALLELTTTNMQESIRGQRGGPARRDEIFGP